MCAGLEASCCSKKRSQQDSVSLLSQQEHIMMALWLSRSASLCWPQRWLRMNASTHTHTALTQRGFLSLCGGTRHKAGSGEKPSCAARLPTNTNCSQHQWQVGAISLELSGGMMSGNSATRGNTWIVTGWDQEELTWQRGSAAFLSLKSNSLCVTILWGRQQSKVDLPSRNYSQQEADKPLYKSEYPNPDIQVFFLLKYSHQNITMCHQAAMYRFFSGLSECYSEMLPFCLWVELYLL